MIEGLILTVIALLWARWSKFDLAFRAPLMKGAWPWSILFIAWIVCERAVLYLSPDGIDSAWLQKIEQLSLAQYVLLFVLIGPITEELLFRGAMFSALMRRWGVRTAVIVPSILWALLHVQYEPWVIASIAISGVMLAIIRWESGSLYVPIALHSAYNLCDLVLSYLP